MMSLSPSAIAGRLSPISQKYLRHNPYYGKDLRAKMRMVFSTLKGLPETLNGKSQRLLPVPLNPKGSRALSASIGSPSSLRKVGVSATSPSGTQV